MPPSHESPSWRGTSTSLCPIRTQKLHYSPPEQHLPPRGTGKLTKEQPIHFKEKYWGHSQSTPLPRSREWLFPVCGPKPRALRHSLLCAPKTLEERAIIFTPLTEGDIVAQHQELCLKWVASSSQGGGGHVLGGSPLTHSRGPVS